MSENKKKNIIWFCTDQQHYNTITAMGNSEIKTPNLDRFIREGVAFRNTYCQCPVCTPSRASFLTGRYPRSTKVCYNGNDTFSKDEFLVTKMLADAGYICGLVGKCHLTAAQDPSRVELRTDDGYAMFKWSHHPHDDWASGVNSYQEWLKEKGYRWEDIYGGRYLHQTVWPPVPQPNFTGVSTGTPPELHQTTWCVEEAIQFIEKNNRAKEKKPWLVSINSFDPHPPLDPPQAYKDKLDPETLSLPLWQDGEFDNKPPHYLNDYIKGGQEGATESVIGMSDEQKRELRRDYYAQIMLIDDQFGRLIDYLDENDLREDTIVIFHSDHGEMNGDHGLHWKGAYFYEQLVHVPMIWSCPGTILQDRISNALVELVDIAPTLLELCGFEIPQAMQGKSLASLLTGESDLNVHKDSIYTEYYGALYKSQQFMFATMYYDGRFKLVCYHGEQYGELYDLDADPHEFNNLWDNIKYRDLKHELIKKNFDNAILRNRDYSLGRSYHY